MFYEPKFYWVVFGIWYIDCTMSDWKKLKTRCASESFSETVGVLWAKILLSFFWHMRHRLHYVRLKKTHRKVCEWTYLTNGKCSMQIHIFPRFTTYLNTRFQIFIFVRVKFLIFITAHEINIIHLFAYISTVVSKIFDVSLAHPHSRTLAQDLTPRVWNHGLEP